MHLLQCRVVLCVRQTEVAFFFLLDRCVHQLSDMDMDQRLGWLWENSRETYDTARKGLQTNYYGTKQVIEACLPLLKASSDGRIVNVSSHFGQLRVRSSNHYGSEYEIV